MDLHLANQVVIITGGASGIGRATAEYFRREGARLVLADAQGPALHQAVTELRAAGVEVVGEHIDVRDYAACERMVTAAVMAFGRVDVLVNSAGIAGIPTLLAETNPTH
jgi:NAD(P)-dependent dehydrogenase (short-subunit alcohol dehydrogenase family)